jgi:1-acyl-sn-glycerol-3-phosphate acyltransferase
LFGIVFLADSALASMLRNPPLARRIVAASARLLFRLAAIPLSARGLDKLPEGRHVLLVNHTSFLDALVLFALLPARPGYVFAVRQQFRSQQLLCPLLRALGTVVLRGPRKQNDHRNTALMLAALRNETNLAVFPEGMFARTPGVRPFHTGAFFVAAHAGVPLAIAALHGTRAALPLGSWMLRRMPIELEIGPAFHIGGDERPEALSAARDAAHCAMVALSGEGGARQEARERVDAADRLDSL